MLASKSRHYEPMGHQGNRQLTASAARLTRPQGNACGIDRSIRITRVCLTASFAGFRPLWLSARIFPFDPGSRGWKELP